MWPDTGKRRVMWDLRPDLRPHHRSFRHCTESSHTFQGCVAKHQTVDLGRQRFWDSTLADLALPMWMGGKHLEPYL